MFGQRERGRKGEGEEEREGGGGEGGRGGREGGGRERERFCNWIIIGVGEGVYTRGLA